jgi:sugar phosphate isomerase/epimerase
MRKMTICLTPGSIGVKANQLEAIQFAHDFGYEAVQPYPEELALMSDSQINELKGRMKAMRLVWGQAGLPVDFRKDDAKFQDDLKALPKLAAALNKAGATRIGTWVMSNHATLTYKANFELHSQRIGRIADVLADHNQRLGLEYVGPKTLWTANRYPFIHTLAEMRDLITGLRATNVGLVLDSWHWYTANESVADLKTLTNMEVVCIDLNDAPAGISVDKQIDNQREIPMATGVIDMDGFLNALASFGCDAPARPEPFNSILRAKPREEILSTVVAAMKKAMSLVRG